MQMRGAADESPLAKAKGESLRGHSAGRCVATPPRRRGRRTSQTAFDRRTGWAGSAVGGADLEGEGDSVAGGVAGGGVNRESWRLARLEGCLQLVGLARGEWQDQLLGGAGGDLGADRRGADRGARAGRRGDHGAGLDRAMETDRDAFGGDHVLMGRSGQAEDQVVGRRARGGRDQGERRCRRDETDEKARPTRSQGWTGDRHAPINTR
jgi:hypothetical protein